MLSAIPVEVRFAAAMVTAILAAVVGLGIWCVWRGNWHRLFAVVWLGTAAAVVSAVVLAMPYANQRLRLQAEGPALDRLAVRNGQLATWGPVPDFFRYYTSIDLQPLRDEHDARAFFASPKPVFCLVRTRDLASLERAAGVSLRTWARYVAQDRTYLLVARQGPGDRR